MLHRWKIASVHELVSVAREVLELLPVRTDATLLGLEGDLGAGKTTFTQMLAMELGVTDAVLSPTFVIAKRYTTTHTKFTSLVHIDAYRLADGAALRPLRFDEMLCVPRQLIVLEWPSLVADGLPGDRATLTFVEGATEGEREITLSLPPVSQ